MALRPLQLQLDWRNYDGYGQGDAYAALPAQGEGFGKAAALCIGSRQCQKALGQAGDKGVMCPSYRVTQDDLHSTRGRAAVLREALNGNLGDQPFADGALDDAMALCVACKGCKRECPNGVDMAALRAETLAQRWAGRPVPWRTRFFAGMPKGLPHLRRFRWAMVLRERIPGVAWLIERLFGIAAKRSIPRIAPRAFLDETAAPVAGAAPHGEVAQTDPPRDVVLMVDCFSNHLDPDIARATLALLQRSGYRLHLLRAPAGEAPLCCGRTAFSAGLIVAARDHARRLLAMLAPHAAAGRPIIGLEPSCLSMLRDEFLQLGLDAEQVHAVSKSAHMLEEFLARELDAKRWTPPPATTPTRVLVHGHCHQKAFGTVKALRKVLAAVPGLQVDWVESSCCGMAGSFGFEAEHHAISMRMAELALLPAVRAAAPETLFVANGTSCRHQIRDGAGRDALHLAQLLHYLSGP